MPAFIVVLALLGCATSASASEETPVQKVVQLMEGMLAKGKAQKHDEQVQFAAYKQESKFSLPNGLGV